MNKSNTIAELSKALAKAQAEMQNPHFDAINPHFRSKYASLATVREAVLPVLNKHGLSLAQFPICNGSDERPTAGCVNLLTHTSGEFVEEPCLLPLDKANAHGAGSAITYARRYSMQSIGGVVGDEDDDANGAVATPKETKSEPDKAGASLLRGSKTLEELADIWRTLKPEQRSTLGPIKDARKKQLLEAEEATQP